MRDTCARHIADLERTDAEAPRFDPVRADRAAAWFTDVLRLGSGPFALLPWQEFVVRSLFGWVRPDGIRRFRRCYIETAKGSGKSPLTAGIALYMIVADGERRAEGYVCARTMEQALVAYRDAVAMIHDSPVLSQRLNVAGIISPYSIDHFESGSFLKRIATNTTGEGRSGYRPHIIVADEYHEHASSATLDMLVANVKARKQPLTMIVTNAGSNMSSACGVEHTYAKRVASGEAVNDEYFPFVCELDEGDDPHTDESVWPKTNPSLPALPGSEYIRSQLTMSAGMPSKLARVDRLLFCRWSEAESPWLDYDRLLAVESDDIDRSGSLYMGLDLSARKDLTAAALVWRHEDDTMDAEIRVWTPGDTLDDRAVTDNTPYRDWVNDGHMFAPPGPTLDYGHVAGFISQVMSEYDLRALAYDPWRIDVLIRELAAHGVDASRLPLPGALRIVPHPQGFVSGAGSTHKGIPTEKLWMPRSIDALEDAILNGMIRIKRNPCLRAAMLGCVVVMDASSNRRFNKLKAQTRIDPAVALTMATGLAANPAVAGGGLVSSLLSDGGIV